MNKENILNSPMQRGRTLRSKQIKNFMSDLDLIFENKRILEVGCGKGNLLRDIKIKFLKSEVYGIDIYTPVKENMEYFQYINLDLNQNDFMIKIPERLDIIFSFRCFMYLNIDKRLELIRGFYEKLKIGGTMLIDICGSEDNPSELSDSDFELLSYISKKLRNTDKLIKKNYNPEIELLDQKPTEKDLEIIRRIKNIDTYSLFVKKTKEKILI